MNEAAQCAACGPVDVLLDAMALCDGQFSCDIPIDDNLYDMSYIVLSKSKGNEQKHLFIKNFPKFGQFRANAAVSIPENSIGSFAHPLRGPDAR